MSAEQAPTAYILLGPSGNGKSSLARGLEARQDGPYFFERNKPWTTRRQRNAEDDDYVFMSPEQFKAAEQAGEFTTVNESYGNRFGIRTYKPTKPNTFPLYILLPSNALMQFSASESRKVFIDRYPVNYEKTLRERDPSINEAELTRRLGSIAAERLMADDIADLEFHNDVPLDEGIEALYQILAADISRRESGI